MHRSAIFATIAVLALAPAFAQQATAPAPAETDRSFIESQSSEQWLASNLIGMSVNGPDEESIGAVNDLLLDGNGEVVGAVIGVGGFLGIGRKDVAVPFASLDLARKDDGSAEARVQFTKDELNDAPDFQAYEPPTAASRVPGLPGGQAKRDRGS
jgi:hypothetical protein